MISAKSFPVNYWDKFVKKKVRQKYSETYDFDAISNLLGMEKSSLSQEEEVPSGFVNSLLAVDWRYQVGVDYSVRNWPNICVFILNMSVYLTTRCGKLE